MKPRRPENRVWRDDRMTDDLQSGKDEEHKSCSPLKTSNAFIGERSTVNGFSSVLWRGVDLGTVPYPDALNLQHKLVEAVSLGAISGAVLMLEHLPVFTLGQRGGLENLRVPPAFLERSGISVIQAERGGNITFHGPGQLVVYPVIDLKPAGLSVAGYVEALEEVMIRTAADWNISAGRNPAGRGVWVGVAKLGSIGIRVRRTVAFHGLALNVSVSLVPFDWINPCGLEGVCMTSMVQSAGRDISMTDVRRAVVRHMEAVFGVAITMTDEAALKALLDIQHISVQ
jgi:lipoyl(octanoyl) transferase